MSLLLSMKPLINLPSWLFFKVARRLLHKGHPWREREKFFSLSDWHQGATPVLMEYDLGLWCCLMSLAAIAAAIVLRTSP